MHLLLPVLASFLAAAQGPERRLQVETYDLGLTDVGAAAEAVRPLLSPEGRVVEDERNHRLIVVDVASVQRAVRAALQKVEVQARNIRVMVTFRWQAAGDRTGARVRPRDGGVAVGGDVTRSSSRTTSRQELVVLSGGRASLRIADEVPYADWFWTWGLGRGMWVEGVKWRDVASGMEVEPLALPDGRIRIRLTPYFEYFIDTARQVTRLHTLTTEVVANDGEEIQLGGVPANDSEFRERFLIGFDRARGMSQASIVLRATVE
jgi:type II secretory pathway component GspD/PulD (secretin)